MDETAKLIALFGLAAFAMERITATANAFIDAERLRHKNHHFAARKRQQGRRKALLVALGAAVALAVIDLSNLRIMRLVQGAAAPQVLDYWLTWLILVAGADRVRDLLRDVKSGTPKSTPVFALKTENPIRELRQVS